MPWSAEQAVFAQPVGVRAVKGGRAQPTPSGKELGDGDGTEGWGLTAGQPGFRALLSLWGWGHAAASAAHRAAGCSRTGPSGCGCCIYSGFVGFKYEQKLKKCPHIPASSPTRRLAAILGWQ